VIEFVDSSYGVRVPVGVSVSRSRPVEDFDLYLFTRQSEGQQPILIAYVGNHPDIKRLPSESQSPAAKRKQRQCWEDQLGRGCEVLVRLPEQNWPQYVHFYYEGLSPKYARLADQIIRSLHRVK
jgi:hypothetical protein